MSATTPPDGSATAGAEGPLRIGAGAIVGAIFAGLLIALADDPVSLIPAGVILGSAFGILVALGLDGVLDRRRFGTQKRQLEGGQPGWNTIEREACQRRIDAKRAEGEATGYDESDGDSSRYTASHIYEREYEDLSERWQSQKENRLRSRTLSAGAASVLAALGTVLMLSPARLQQAPIIALVWPFALCLLLALGLTLEIHLRGRKWDDLFLDWKDWAKEATTEKVTDTKAEEQQAAEKENREKQEKENRAKDAAEKLAAEQEKKEKAAQQAKAEAEALEKKAREKKAEDREPDPPPEDPPNMWNNPNWTRADSTSG